MPWIACDGRAPVVKADILPDDAADVLLAQEEEVIQCLLP